MMLRPADADDDDAEMPQSRLVGDRFASFSFAGFRLEASGWKLQVGSYCVVR